MVQLSYNNHFKFGYGDGKWFQFRQSSDERWLVRYGPVIRPSAAFRDECYATACLIRDTTDGPLTILFSGGVDSEVVVRSFHAQGIPVNIAICQFTDNLNVHDVSFAVVCCEQLGIPYQLISLDINRFLERDAIDYAVQAQARSAIFCSTMWLADQVDGLPIFGAGECYIRKRSADDEATRHAPSAWDLHEREHVVSWYRHFLKPGRERKAVPGFFQYTPEIMLSFLRDPTVIDLVNNRTGRLSTMTLKLPIYQKYFPLAERKKYTGYEKLMDAVDRIDTHLKKLFPHSALHMTEYNELVAMLQGDA